MRPENRADDRQRESRRAEWHAMVDRIADAWPVIDRIRTEMGRGYPSRGDGGSSGGEGNSPTERFAIEAIDRPGSDPATLADEWFAEMAELHGRLRSLDAKRHRLLPATPEPESGRTNSVELCAECGEPAPKVKRLDGAAIHHPDDTGCWWVAYNRTRGRRGA